MIVGDAQVRISPEHGAGQKFASKTKSELMPGLKSVAAAAAGVFVGAKLFEGLHAVLATGFGELKDYQAGLAQTKQVIQTTGGAAGVSADHVEKLASSIQNYSGQTDDSIVKSQDLLLTFTNIRNSAGKNNDIFDQATKITADMAKVFGGDASTSAIQLGKALNDPTAGITALSRVGVSFSEAQKKTIKSMQDSGNMAGAQKVILAELSKEVGGSAAAYGKTLPGQIDRAKRSFEDVAQTVATAVLPVLTRVLAFLTTTVFPALGRFAAYVQAYVVPALKQLGTFIVTNVLPVLQRLGVWIQTNVLPVLQRLGVFIVNTVLPAFQKAAAFIGGQAAAAFRFVAEKVKENLPQLESLGRTIGKVAEVIAKVAGPALVVILGGALRVVGTAIGIAITVVGKIVTAFQAVGTAGQVLWDTLKVAFRFIIDSFLNVASTVIHGAAGMFGWVPGIGGKLKGAAKSFDDFRAGVDATLSGAAKSATVQGDAIGANLALGAAAGIKAHSAQVAAQAAAMVHDAAFAARHAAGVASPSKAFAEIGRRVAEGFAAGIDASAHLGSRSAGNMVTSALGTARGTVPPGGVGTGAGGATINVYPREGQSETQIARHTMAELLFAQLTGGAVPATAGLAT